MSEELKPCPFCGGEPIQHRAPWGYQVTCAGCGAAPRDNSNANHLERDEAALIWNTRAETPQSIPSEREEIVKWLRSLRLEPLMPDDIADVIEGGEHTRQALEQGSAE